MSSPFVSDISWVKGDIFPTEFCLVGWAVNPGRIAVVINPCNNNEHKVQNIEQQQQTTFKTDLKLQVYFNIYFTCFLLSQALFENPALRIDRHELQDVRRHAVRVQWADPQLGQGLRRRATWSQSAPRKNLWWEWFGWLPYFWHSFSQKYIGNVS